MWLFRYKFEDTKGAIIKMSIFAWYLALFSFFQEINADSHKKFPQAPFKKLNILPLVIYMFHDYSLFSSTADFVIKKEHLGFLPDLVISKRQRRRQTSGESASLPQYLGCNTVFDMRLRVTFLRRKTVSLQSNIAHRE